MKHMSLKEIHDYLSKRGEKDRFLSDADREEFVNYLVEWNYSWIRDESPTTDDMNHNRISLDSCTDAELVDEFATILKHEDEEEFRDDNEWNAKILRIYSDIKAEEALLRQYGLEVR